MAGSSIMNATHDLSYLPHVMGVAGAAGIGLALMKYLGRHARRAIDQETPQDLIAGVEVKKRTPARFPMEVRVTQEEAEELRASGVDVPVIDRRKKRPQSPAGSVFPQFKTGQAVPATRTPSVVNAAIYGGAGLTAFAVGLMGADFVINKLRRRAQEKERDKLQARLSSVLAGNPMQDDQVVYSGMKLAEAVYKQGLTKSAMDKTASVWGLLAAAGLLAGGAATVRFLGGTRSALTNDAARQSASTLQQLYDRAPEERPRAYLRPVQILDDVEPLTEERPEDNKENAVTASQAQAAIEKERERRRKREEARLRALSKIVEKRQELPVVTVNVAPASAPAPAAAPAPAPAPVQRSASIF